MLIQPTQKAARLISVRQSNEGVILNQLFRDLVIARVEAAVTEARAAVKVPHPGIKGQLREILVRELFRPLLPAYMGVGHGHILSSVEGKISSEQDIVIYDQRLVPPVLYERSLGMFPIECTLATVEVKSRLTAHELQSTDKKVAELFDFKYQSGLPAAQLPPNGVVVERVSCSLFALDTDLSENGISEIERYKSLPGCHSEALRAICVVGRGYWYRYGDDWKTTAQNFKFAEVAGFLAGTLGLLERVAESRGKPSLANYLFEDGQIS